MYGNPYGQGAAASPPPLQHPGILCSPRPADPSVPVHPIQPVRSPPPPQHQHQHQQSQHSSVYNPVYAPSTSHSHLPPQQHQYAQQFGQFLGVNDATAQIGLSMMNNVASTGQQYVQQNVLRVFNTTSLKPYFNVSTPYVVRKIRLLLFPWRHKPWSRQMRRNEVSGATEGYKPPREDVNAPDLYIPGTLPTLPALFSLPRRADADGGGFSHGFRHIHSSLGVFIRHSRSF